MIITQLKEGLGNQLFQYFFTRSLGVEDYKFDISFYGSNGSRKLDLIDFPKFNLKFLDSSKGVLEDLKYIKDEFQFLNINIDNNKNYYFDGYWQNKLYLDKINDLVIQEMQPEEKLINYINKKYAFLKEDCVSIHVRRTDYMHLSNYYYLLDENYYNQALSFFDKNVNIAVFSDDIEWCKSNLKYKNIHFIEESARVDMIIMSLCKSNIIANSTFSFWGAYLNANENKKIICPQKWLKESYSLLISNQKEPDCAKNLIKDDWIRIEVHLQYNIYTMNQAIQETYYGKKIDTANILNIEDAAKLINNRKTVIITGVTGQDGSHMVEFLLKNTDLLIFGGVRRLSVYNHENVKDIKSDRFHLINFDLTDTHSIARVVEKIQPEYFINFAAQSFVASSWDFARQTWQTNSTAVLDILEAIRLYKPSCRLYQAGSSEEFGDVLYTPQDEEHPLRPRSPYGASKAAARQLVKVYRESYNIYAIQGWLFNHEGTRRGEEFVTRKITKNVARIFNAIKNKEAFIPLELGNLEAKRDWSDAEDFIQGVWMMLNQDKYNPNYNGIPKEYVFSSNEAHTIKEFVEKAFSIVGIKGKWLGEGEHTIYISEDNKTLVQINPKFYRPAEVELLLGNSNKARKELNWKPRVSFDALVEKMVKNDIENV